MSEAINETRAIQRARAGDPQAFAELVNAHQQFLYNLALRATSNPQEAQDAAQEAFIRAWRGLKNFRGESGFRTWLYRILMNLCYDRYPRLKREKDNLSIEEEAYDHPVSAKMEQTVDRQELRGFVHRQLQSLPKTYRVVLLLRYQQDLSYQEIAEIMEMPMGTVKTTLFRAKAQLKESILAEQEVSAWIA